MDFSGTLLVSGSKDGLVKLWNTCTGKCVCTFRHAKHIGVNCVKLSNSVAVSSCDKGVIKVWCCKARKLKKVLLGHHGSVNDLCMDDFFIISGSNDGFVMSWTKETDYKNHVKSFRHPKGVFCVQLLYLRVVSGCMDGKVRVFNLISGECLRVIRGNSNCDPILSLKASTHRLIVNTASSLLLMQFEEMKDSSSFPQHCPNSICNVLNSPSRQNLRSQSAPLQRTVNQGFTQTGFRSTMSAMPKKEFETLSRNRSWINYPSYFVSIFSMITTGYEKNVEKDQCIKGSSQQTFEKRLKDGTFLRISNLQRSNGNSTEDICTLINAAPTDTRELLQRTLCQNTSQMESWISSLQPSDISQSY
uniref:F-box/WD repeat-containing protein 10-like n=1 Tax=Phallusia mammillata TaxID=59560 RepID=A0A6F9DC05_9ASCI|nr:F-box/WD repeat-containing protein 10-like [Phallusia mammillata]